MTEKDSIKVTVRELLLYLAAYPDNAPAGPLYARLLRKKLREIKSKKRAK